MEIIKQMAVLAAVLAIGLTSVSLSAGPKGPTIVDVAIAANAEGGPYEGVFDTLIAAVLAADEAVLDTLTGNGQHTVFAPTDDAFDALGLDETNVGALPQDALTEILLYHVAHGRRNSDDVIDSERIRTLQGGFLLQDGGILTDSNGDTATTIVPDVPAANGIIHAIDAVVLPFEL